jgi:hypothetical protein
MVASDLFTVDTMLLRRLFVLFFIEIDTRRIYLIGITANPVGEWVTQQARNLSFVLAEQAHPRKFLIRDRDAKFSSSVDEVFRAEGVRIIRTPIRSPRANAFAERFAGTVRRECLERMLVFRRRQLETVLSELVDHYNEHRAHRSLASRRRSPQGRGHCESAIRIRANYDGATNSAASFTSTDSWHELLGVDLRHEQGRVQPDHLGDGRRYFLIDLRRAVRSVLDFYRDVGQSAVEPPGHESRFSVDLRAVPTLVGPDQVGPTFPGSQG